MQALHFYSQLPHEGFHKIAVPPCKSSPWRGRPLKNRWMLDFTYLENWYSLRQAEPKCETHCSKASQELWSHVRCCKGEHWVWLDMLVLYGMFLVCPYSSFLHFYEAAFIKWKFVKLYWDHGLHSPTTENYSWPKTGNNFTLEVFWKCHQATIPCHFHNFLYVWHTIVFICGSVSNPIHYENVWPLPSYRIKNEKPRYNAYEIPLEQSDTCSHRLLEPSLVLGFVISN